MDKTVTIETFLEVITDDIAGDFPQELQDARNEFKEIIDILDGDYDLIYEDTDFQNAMQSTIDLFNEWMQTNDVEIIEAGEEEAAASGEEGSGEEEKQEETGEFDADIHYNSGSIVELDTGNDNMDDEKETYQPEYTDTEKKAVNNSTPEEKNNQDIEKETVADTTPEKETILNTNTDTETIQNTNTKEEFSRGRGEVTAQKENQKQTQSTERTMQNIPNLKPEQWVIVEKIRATIPGKIDDNTVLQYFSSIRQFCYYIADHAIYEVNGTTMQWGWYTVYNVYQKIRDYDAMR